jgi:hypothetical protein
MTKPKDDVERLIAACAQRNVGRGPETLARAILEGLWEAGYDVTRRPDMIPIRRSPGEDGAPRATRQNKSTRRGGVPPAELVRRRADKLCNAPIREKIGKIAGKFGSR